MLTWLAVSRGQATCCFIVLGHCLLDAGLASATHRKRIKKAARAFREYTSTCAPHGRACVIVTGGSLNTIAGKNSAGSPRRSTKTGKQLKRAVETEAEVARDILVEHYKLPRRSVLVETSSTNTGA